MRIRLVRLSVSFALLTGGLLAAEKALLPAVPADLTVALVAREPLLRNPCAMAFDARGRLFVGQGPQYRNPKPDTPGDTILILIDSDGDGVFDQAKTFASGLNCIQGLAWHGRDLWVGNSPDLTILRDLDGDDVADEYVKVFTDLGNIEHAVHGLNWAPDGKLYLSQGTSKGLTQPGRTAPKAFRDLWDVRAPAGTPDVAPAQVFKRADYQATYQDPRDDWGREGGVLRCDDLGANLEIVARGLRNPWDLAFDSGFNWLNTDNDQSEGDRITMPFFGAHFGWGHVWSTHWTGHDHLPTVPISGPVFDGSGTGIVYYDAPQLPPAYRGVWFFNDWLRKSTFVYRPRWEGALLQPVGGRWEPLARGGGAGRSVSGYGGKREADAAAPPTALYKPVEILVGPDGALFVSGWGEQTDLVLKDGQQINEGRIFRISWPSAPATTWKAAKRTKPLTQWSVAELVEDLGALLPIWSVDAQDELVRRGGAARAALVKRLSEPGLTEAGQTWALWTLGRMAPQDRSLDEWFAATGHKLSLNARIQSIRIAAHRIREHRPADAIATAVVAALQAPEPRVRFAAVQAIAQAKQRHHVAQLTDVAATESDRVTFYAVWQALRELAAPPALQSLLKDGRAGVRRAALLALLESRALAAPAVQPFVQDSDPVTAGIAASWLAKSAGNPLIDIYPKPGDFFDSVNVRLTPGIKPATLRYTLDGSEPTARSEKGGPGRFTSTTTLKAALFVNDQKVGNSVGGVYRKRDSHVKLPALGGVDQPTTVSQVLALLPAANPQRGPDLFTAAGCVACHRVGDTGRTVGPDLSAIGDRDDADSVIRSILLPNQIIVEGYSLLTVTTKDGQAYAGILESENDRSLNVVQLNGESVAIDRATITNRQSIHQSPMPAFDRVLAPAQLADLVAWLMAQRALPEKTETVTPRAKKSAAVSPGVTWGLKADRLAIHLGGGPAADAIFKNEQTARPQVQNLPAPSGQPGMRQPPPAATAPPAHAPIHPGRWLAFGDINGQDLWRNQGWIELVKWATAPALSGGHITFATENHLVGADDQTPVVPPRRLALSLSKGHAFLLTWPADFISAGTERVWGDQEEMGFGGRLATSFTEKNGGAVVNRAGLRGAKAAWGKPAAWAAYSREINGRVLGAAIFSAEANPTPIWWQRRDDGLMVVNGCVQRVRLPAANGPSVLNTPDSLKLHSGLWRLAALDSAPIDFSKVNLAL